MASKRHVVYKEILVNITMELKPDTITLVLGQPSFGKSALTKVLSSRFSMTKSIKMYGRHVQRPRPRSHQQASAAVCCVRD